MAREVEKLTLVSFSTESDNTSLCAAVRSLGYQITLIGGEQWLKSVDYSADQATILLLGQNDCPHREIIAALKNLVHSRVVCVFTCNDKNWAENIIDCCVDFLGWPCHKDELAFRFRKVFGDAGNAGNVTRTDLNGPSQVEEFVDLNMVGQAPVFLEALRLIKKFARCDAHVLIEGETGTGKELASRAIHYLSARRGSPFIPVNCGAIPDSLIENEFFGHEKGAFTDASKGQIGLVAQANGGTLFLDEIDALSAKSQVTLLRFLEDQEYRPIGSGNLKKVDVRIVVDSNARLDELCAKNLFRKDLMYRLKILSVELPPLRERPGDLELLAKFFIQRMSSQYKTPAKTLHPATLLWMEQQHWEGNVRELENLLYRGFLLADGPQIVLHGIDVHGKLDSRFSRKDMMHWSDVTFRDAKASFEKSYLSWLMAETSGNISLASRRAGKQRTALRKMLQKHKIDKNDWIANPTDTSTRCPS